MTQLTPPQTVRRYFLMKRRRSTELDAYVLSKIANLIASKQITLDEIEQIADAVFGGRGFSVVRQLNRYMGEEDAGQT